MCMRIARALALFPDEVLLPATLGTVKGHVFRYGEGILKGYTRLICFNEKGNKATFINV
jgi:hypothetical protein